MKKLMMMGMVLAAAMAAGANTLFVAPSGADGGDGSFERPFTSLWGAQEAARKIHATNSEERITVYLRGGEYRLRTTHALYKEDSRVAWKAWKDERPVLTGATRLKGFRPSPDLPGAFVADARAAGYDGFDEQIVCGLSWGGHGPGVYNFNRRVNGLYVNGRLQTLARHPNQGYLKMDKVLDPVRQVFRMSEELSKFRLDFAAAPDLYAAGYFKYLWGFEIAKIRQRGDGSFALDRRTMMGAPGSDAITEGYPLYLANARDFVDAPGEWYLDRVTGMVTLIPPEGVELNAAEVVLADADFPLWSLYGAEEVTVEGLVFEYGQSDAVRFQKAKDCSFERNVVRNFGGMGLVAMGEGIRCRRNVIHTTGFAAAIFIGGDRATLTGSRCVIEGNDIYDSGLVYKTYSPGVDVSGVGMKIVRNHLHDMASTALHMSGNDHLVISNLIEDVVKESDDQGAVDIFGDPTYGGCVFRHNVFRNVRAHGIGSSMTAGIRFDDGISMMTVEGNRFENCCDGYFGSVQIHMGRFNVVTNNLMVGGPGGVSVSDWAANAGDPNRWRSYILGDDPVKYPDNCKVRGYFRNVDVNSEVWRKRFPWLAHAEDTICTNTVACNVLVNVKETVMRQNGHTADVGNRRFGRMPSDEELAKIPGFTVPPTADEVWGERRWRK